MQIECSHVYMGNTVFSPLIGSANVLRQLHNMRECFRWTTSIEYTHLVHSRLDFQWLAPHPIPIHNDSVYIPTGEDYYGGINDRHAVIPRNYASMYMNRIERIIDGRILVDDRQLRRGRVSNTLATQDENFVRMVLRAFPKCASIQSRTWNVVGMNVVSAKDVTEGLPSQEVYIQENMLPNSN